MTQTGKLEIDFTTPGFKQATNTGFMDMFNATVPARFEITFSKPFASVPVVILSITGLKIYSAACTNFTVDPVDITMAAFKIEVVPRSGNNINDATICWLATDS